jgi:hypothetical protein
MAYDGSAFLLVDGCPAHFSDYFTDRCSFFALELIVMPPHSSDPMQPPDLVTFEITKRKFAQSRDRPGLTEESALLARMMHSIWTATTPDKVTGAFVRAGICVDCCPVHRELIL